MKSKKDEFVENDDGAVTVDWVVLCAVVVGLAAIATFQFTDSFEVVGTYIATHSD